MTKQIFRLSSEPFMIVMIYTMNSLKRQKDMTLKDEAPYIPRLVSVQYAPEEEQRNSSKKNEEAESKQK